MNSIQKVALYMRLSKEDLDKGNAESESIQNQRMILDEYASSHGWEIYDHYIDEDSLSVGISKLDILII